MDGIIDKVVRHIFDVMKSMPKADLVGARYGTKMAERKTLLTKAKKDYTKAGKLIFHGHSKLVNSRGRGQMLRIAETVRRGAGGL